MVFGQQLLFSLVNIPRGLPHSLLTQFGIVALPLAVELLVEVDLGVLMMMFELLPQVDVSDGPESGREGSPVQFEDAIVESESVSEELLELVGHVMMSRIMINA